MIGYYRVAFQLNGKNRHDILFGYNAQYAADAIREEYGPMGEVKITHVWRDTGRMYETTEDWD